MYIMKCYCFCWKNNDICKKEIKKYKTEVSTKILDLIKFMLYQKRKVISKAASQRNLLYNVFKFEGRAFYFKISVLITQKVSRWR